MEIITVLMTNLKEESHEKLRKIMGDMEFAFYKELREQPDIKHMEHFYIRIRPHGSISQFVWQIEVSLVMNETFNRHHCFNSVIMAVCFDIHGEVVRLDLDGQPASTEQILKRLCRSVMSFAT